MFTRPEGLSDGDVIAGLASGWGIEASTVEYLAVGFGSHHWSATGQGEKYFVTVDSLGKERAGESAEAVLANLAAAFETARALQRAGHEFVLAPLDALGGQVVRRLNDDFSIAVFPWVDGETNGYGGWRSEDQKRAVRDVLDALHTEEATALVAGTARREDFELPCQPALHEALAELDAQWDAGPYAEPTRGLLSEVEADVHRALDVYRDLVDVVRHKPFFITHGEPHSGNVLWTAGGPMLIDWDTALIAPRGRDLWMLEEDGKLPPADEQRTDNVLYRLWWDLAEIAEYVRTFRTPHGDTEDMQESWRNLQRYARLRATWTELL